MMNRLYRIWMVVPALMGLGLSLNAQSCDWRALPGVTGQPALLDLLVGDFALAPNEASGTDRSAYFIGKLDAGEVMNPDSGGLRQSLFEAGLAALETDHPADAARLFSAAGAGMAEDLDCGLRFFRLTAKYLSEFGSQEPIFPHFNGGFYNYLRDSLFWSATDTVQYEQALTAAVEMVQWTAAGSSRYLELLGDLLTGHRDRFFANYFSWLAYQRAATLHEGALHDAYERKAVFALEYPQTNEDRFNRYRYTQLGKALAEDMSSVRTASETYPVAPPLRFFPDSSSHRLHGMLKKAREEQIARSQRVLKYDQEVNRKVVKRDTRFNAYALFLIAVIIGSVIFFWVKLRRAGRTR